MNVRAYKKIYSYLEARGLKPKLHKLDNETSADVEEFITAQQAKYQYAPPDIRWSNSAEKGFQTYKNHLTAGIARLPDDSPIAFWDRLTPQGDWSLNIMRPCRLNPKLSAFEALEVAFHFTSTPFAPPGKKVLAHETPGRRASWGFHANKGWYIGPALNNHQ